MGLGPTSRRLTGNIWHNRTPGSPPIVNLPAGPTTFIVTYNGSASVLEYEIGRADRIIGGAEDGVPGINRGFTLNLKPGALPLNCPGGTSAATRTLTVTE
jgi:hypothetical protein